MNHLSRVATPGFALAWAIAQATGPPAAAAQGTGADGPPGARITLTTWAPAYSAPLPLPDTDGSFALLADGAGLWLATETEVARFEDGVWRERQSPPGVGKIFALAHAGPDLWAFGFQGGIWRRTAGQWSAVASPVAADLYAAASRESGDTWAAGFDYDTEQGTLVRVDGQAVTGFSPPWLHRQQLFALAVTPSGELWAGGCDYADHPILLRDRGVGDWVRQEAPPLVGCVYHLSFGPDGAGLAAAGSDLWRWDGTAWQAEGAAPPDGYQWVRVADAGARSLDGEPAPPAGYAVAGTPTWRGYIDGQPAWSFDGRFWKPATAEEGGGAPSAEAATVVDLTADGSAVWAASRVIETEGAEGRAVIQRLVGGASRVHHPHLLASSNGDVAALPGGQVWVAGNRGRRPLLHRSGERWSPDATGLPGPTGQVRLSALDFASGEAGWAVGVLDAPGLPAGQARAWRWDGLAWSEAEPPLPRPAAVRALPDGGAWTASPDLGFGVFDPAANRWTIRPELPAPAPQPTLTGRNVAPFARTWAPFDVSPDGAGPVAWIATDQGIVRHPQRPATPAARPLRGRVLDLQLVDAQRGWAIAWDEAPAPPARPTGVLLRLTAARGWEELTPTRLEGLRGTPRDLEWYLMAVVDAEEVWLYGTVDLNGREHAVLARVLGGVWAAYRLDCRIIALGAARVGRGGTDVWLLGPSAAAACLAGPASGAGAAPPFPGPVSRLQVRRVADRLTFPLLARFWPPGRGDEPGGATVP
jgi:hypothetical protein